MDKKDNVWFKISTYLCFFFNVYLVYIELFVVSQPTILTFKVVINTHKSNVMPNYFQIYDKFI